MTGLAFEPALVVLVGDGSRFFMPLSEAEAEDPSAKVDNRPKAFETGLDQLVTALQKRGGGRRLAQNSGLASLVDRAAEGR